MSLANLRKFSTTVIKDKSATDQAQIPATVDIDVHKRGATVSSGATIISSGGTAAVSVYDVGSLAVSSTLKVGTDATSNLTVTGIASATSITVRNDGASDVALVQYSRLVVTSARPTLYHDTTGAAVLDASGHTTTDARGYVEFYTNELMFDYIATTGSTSALYIDAESGQSAMQRGWYNVNEFISVQAAIDAVPSGATIFFPAGTYTPPSTAGWILTKPVTIMGDGEFYVYTLPTIGTIFRPFNADVNSCVFTMQSDNTHIKNCGIGNQGLPASTGTGDGIRIGNAARDQFGCSIENVNIINMGRHGINMVNAAAFDTAIGSEVAPGQFACNLLRLHQVSVNGCRGVGIRLAAGASINLQNVWSVGNRLEGFRIKNCPTCTMINCATQDCGDDLPAANWRAQFSISTCHAFSMTGTNIEHFYDGPNNFNALTIENCNGGSINGLDILNPDSLGLGAAVAIGITMHSGTKGVTIMGWRVQNVQYSITILGGTKTTGNFIQAPMVLASNATCPALFNIPAEHRSTASSSGGNMAWFHAAASAGGQDGQTYIGGMIWPMVASGITVPAQRGMMIFEASAAGASALQYYDGAAWRVITGL